MIEVQEVGFKSLVRSSGEVGLQQILAGNVSSSGVVVTVESNILLKLRCNCN